MLGFDISQMSAKEIRGTKPKNLPTDIRWTNNLFFLLYNCPLFIHRTFDGYVSNGLPVLFPGIEPCGPMSRLHVHSSSSAAASKQLRHKQSKNLLTFKTSERLLLTLASVNIVFI